MLLKLFLEVFVRFIVPLLCLLHIQQQRLVTILQHYFTIFYQQLSAYIQHCVSVVTSSLTPLGNPTSPTPTATATSIHFESASSSSTATIENAESSIVLKKQFTLLTATKVEQAFERSDILPLNETLKGNFHQYQHKAVSSNERIIGASSFRNQQLEVRREQFEELSQSDSNLRCRAKKFHLSTSEKCNDTNNNSDEDQVLNKIVSIIVGGMKGAEFREHGKQMVDYIVDYLDNIHKRRVVPAIEPGYLRDSLPHDAPEQPESYTAVMDDFEKFIMPGITHWQHPRFHAYFPAGNSFPSILADMISDAIGCMGFSWAACPAMTELEIIMLDWFGKMIGLPPAFLPFTENGRGGGVIQGSASECNFVSLLAARFEVLKELRQRFPFVEEGLLLSKLVAYCSKEAHSSVEKACMIAMVKLRILETDSKFRLRGETLRIAIQEDRNLGLIPFFVSTTLGTTSVCSFDVLSEIGPVCEQSDLWLHVDGAYGGSAMICPEFRYLMSGIEYAMSFNANPNKWMLVNFDCSTMWVKDRYKLTQALVVDPLYLQHSWMDKAIDYRHWGIPLSRRFRSLKLWFVIRMYGVNGLQSYIREHVRLAKKFEQLIRADDTFEIVGDVLMGLVCFRMKASNETNQALLTKLNSSGRIHMVPASLNQQFVIRFCVCAENANERDIQIAYDIISQTAQHIMHDGIVEPLVEEAELEMLEEKAYSNSEDTLNKEVSSMVQLRRSSDSEFLSSALNGLETTAVAVASGCTSKEELLERKNAKSLAEKRSFLVRMVSDPKCYNPKIVRHLNMTNYRKMSEDVARDRTIRQTIGGGSGSSSGSKQSRPRYLLNSENRSGNESDTTSTLNASVDEDVIPLLEQTGLQTPM
ncbi:unnamed protein product [Anisakis simplex]|uniref:Histidine decarboxylase (inferred by orthology to a human protein) n=1 Tax=Anisakis simplex TaxID=6269 RepID=A0A0M3JSN1_ANISI|nr:unnamed protein product [Anisakis simplex]